MILKDLINCFLQLAFADLQIMFAKIEYKIFITYLRVCNLQTLYICIYNLQK